MATAAIIFTIVIHTLGIPVMIWAVRGEEGLKGLWNWLPGEDDDGGDGGSKLPETPDPVGPSGGGIPLPTSEPASSRLREHGDRIADPSRGPRRRVRPQQPEPAREPQRTRR
ncbi:MAG: hypothetical protein J7513_12475 [Solirubrobacteraceae bacterium]|nr:hypothetical protein [Solirubrobacteraceae bacterium]